MLKKQINMLLILAVIIFTLQVPSEATFKDTYDNNASLTVSELKSIKNDIQDVLDAIAEGDMAKLQSTKAPSETLYDMQSQSNAIRAMESRIGVVFDKISITASVINAVRNQIGIIEANVYEVTAFDYHYNDGQNFSDFAAYGSWHYMELRETRDGWQILSDSFDDRDVTGIASHDINVSQGESNIEWDGSLTDGIAENNPKGTNTFGHTSASVRAALSYAVSYCGIPENTRHYGTYDYSSGSSTGSAVLYNHAYVYHSGADCANFVSQCLRASGMPTDSTWYAESNAWIGAYELSVYLKSKYGYSNVTSNFGAVYPGNPVYWEPETKNGVYTPHYHQMICVGYNSSGVPVVCAHTTDVYRMPLTNYTSTHTIYTVKVASSNLHSTHTSSSTYYYNSTYHYHLCQYCEYRVSKASHVVGSGTVCSVCGATGVSQAGFIEHE